VIAEPGSLCVFHGNTWHGAFPKKTNDVRVNTVSAFCRHFVLPAEDTSDLTDEEIAPHGDNLARLLGREKWWGWRHDGPNPEMLTQARVAGESAYN
jgi:ectoine hydroxylase-related dioxygenase (phytanoyl-CoA dioxygenase family)